MLKLKGVHHIAIICSDYERTKNFYTNILGFKVLKETYRSERDSYKLDLILNEKYIIEIFSFQNPPKRPSQPESAGLRHLAFAVEDIEKEVEILKGLQIKVEPIRIDVLTGKKFVFFADPDDLPLELYEI